MRILAKSIGLLVWATIVILIGGLLLFQPLPWTSQVVSFFTSPTSNVDLVVSSRAIRPRTPIFLQTPEREWRLVGHVNKIGSADDPTQPTVAQWYGPRPIEQYSIVYYESNNSLASVVNTLLPGEKQKQVRDRLEELYREHSGEVVKSLKPIFEQSVRDSLPVIEQAFSDSIKNHRQEIDAIAERYKKDIVREKLVPLVREEVFPIVRTHAEPLARQIGRELWDRASVWRFGWRYLYDKSPLPERELVKEEWERFVEREAVPILESHADEMVEAQRKIFSDLSANQEIRGKLKEIGDQILHDKELQSLVTVLFRETLIENQALVDVWVKNWQSDEAKAALNRVGDRLEPVVREIGDTVFGTRETGITPEFARVLRNQILGKDKRWLVAYALPENSTAASQPIIVTRGDDNRAEAPLLVTTPQQMEY